MKKLEQAFAKISKYGNFLADKLINVPKLADIQGVGRGKTVLITGASSGLGAMMAKRFAYLGYDLAICARREDRLTALKTELEAEFDINVTVKTLDVSNYEQIFSIFNAFANELGEIHRIVVNAGIGDSRVIGHGRFDTNRKTAEIDFISALAQCEAGMQIFRRQNFGHLVVISSMSAVRGLPRHLTTYAAAKAGLAHLAEGIRADMLQEKLPIQVSTIYPGYIRTELNIGAKYLPFESTEEEGVEAIVQAIEAKVAEAYVPYFPWLPIGIGMKVLPLKVLVKFL